MIFRKDERPPHGLYKCVECGSHARIDDVNYLMPECPVCKSHEYKKVEDDEQIKNYKEVSE